jgi:hypothetical protein
MTVPVYSLRESASWESSSLGGHLRAIRKILNNVAVLVEGLTARSIVAVVCSCCRKACTGSVRQIFVLDAAVQTTIT